MDEIYTIGSRLLGHISEKLKLVNHSQEFGSCSVLAFGDPSQLCPVADFCLFNSVPELDSNSVEYKGFQGYMAFKSALILWQQMRANEDEKTYKQTLHRVRIGLVSPANLKLLKSTEADNLTKAKRADFVMQAVAVYPDQYSTLKYTEFRLTQTANKVVHIPAFYTSGAPPEIQTSLNVSVTNPVVLTHNVDVRTGLFIGA